MLQFVNQVSCLADELDSGGEANNSSTLTAPTNLTNNQQNSSGFNDSVHRFDTLHFEISSSWKNYRYLFFGFHTSVVDPDQVGSESYMGYMVIGIEDPK